MTGDKWSPARGVDIKLQLQRWTFTFKCRVVLRPICVLNCILVFKHDPFTKCTVKPSLKFEVHICMIHNTHVTEESHTSYYEFY